MQADNRFQNLDKAFWANVRSISEMLGYTERSRSSSPGKIRVYTPKDLGNAMSRLGLSSTHLTNMDGTPTPLGQTLLDYFQHRSDVLNDYVEPRLMDVEEAEALFKQLQAEMESQLPVLMNKQKGDKKTPAYLTAMVNLLIEANAGNIPFDYDPRILTAVTRDDAPLRTLARRVDGCFPACINPIAIWEIKEYYYTTTFGSRVADGVYETLLDGLELEELADYEQIEIEHLLIIDSHFTWWVKGRSYLCRIVDMLHMGYIDEVLFGREIVERLPAVVQGWVERLA